MLALDLGTQTGFACGQSNSEEAGTVVSGSWNLKPDRFQGGGMRFVHFQNRLDELHAATSIALVYYEAVRRHMGTDAAHVYGGLLGTLQAWCERNTIPYDGVPVGTIKKFWCRTGNATKHAMIQQCRHRGFEVDDDNEADALALLHWAFENGAVK